MRSPSGEYTAPGMAATADAIFGGRGIGRAW
jgi:hypothetical protein